MPPRGGDDPFALVRGLDGADELLPAALLDDGDIYTCTGAASCWGKCPEPRNDDGSTWCSCRAVSPQILVCRVKHLEPGEVPPIKEEIRSGSDYYKCGDVRDTLAAEYVGKSYRHGPWHCHKFHKDSRYIVHGRGIENGMKHGYWGYVDGYLTDGMASVEAHFGVTFQINSGYRCPIGNSTIRRASPTSAHILGRAVDFQPFDIDSTWTEAYKDSIIKWAREYAGSDEGSRYETRNHVHLGFHTER